MFLKVIPAGPLATNAILLACEKTKKGFIIDPAPGSFELLVKEIEKEGINVIGILLTDTHWDHIADCKKCKECFQVDVFVHEKDAPNLIKPGSDKLPLYLQIESLHPDHFLKEGDTIPLGEILIDVMETPGHTPGSLCFYLKKEGILISGDTLFQGSYGRVDFPTSSEEKMGDSLKKLAKLPKETKVYPGHGFRTTIGDEDWLIKG